MIDKIGLNSHKFYFGFVAAILVWYALNYYKARMAGKS